MIEPIKNKDREKILKLVEEVKVFNEQEIVVAMEIVDLVLAKKDNGDYKTFSYYDDENHFRGYICFGPIPMTDNRYDFYWIAVDNQARGKGIALKLVDFMEKQIAGMGGGKIYLETSSTPPYAPARGFYEKQGYRIVSILDDFYREGDSKIIFMKNIDNSKQR